MAFVMLLFAGVVISCCRKFSRRNAWAPIRQASSLRTYCLISGFLAC